MSSQTDIVEMLLKKGWMANMGKILTGIFENKNNHSISSSHFLGRSQQRNFFKKMWKSRGEAVCGREKRVKILQCKWL